MLRKSTNDWWSRLRQALVLLACWGLVAYFTDHAIHGRHGLEARTRLIDRFTLLEFEIRSLGAVRSDLARDVAHLGLEPPHPDLVEELARDVLGFAHPRDQIFALEP